MTRFRAFSRYTWLIRATRYAFLAFYALCLAPWESWVENVREKTYLCTMLITLTGFMGSGKSSVGRIVADALGCPFLDLDELIVKKAGRSIPDIFAAEGEAGFRRQEKQMLEQTVSRYAENTAVLALGGGTVTVPGAVDLLQEKTLCIYLQASFETLQSHLEGQRAGRPLADEGMQERLAARLPFYEKAAHVVIDTDGLTPEEIADEIIISCL